MAGIPWARGLDDSAALMLEGYEFGRKRFRQLRSDIFATRLMAQPAIVMMGEEAARLFCDNRRFIRHGALPHRVQATLAGRGGVHGLDDEMHAKRKQLMLAWLMAPDRIDALAAVFQRGLQETAARWADVQRRIVLLREMERVLAETVCEWAGVPLPAADAALRTRQLSALVEAAGSTGPRHWRGRVARKHAEAWLARLVDEVRRREAEGTRDILHAWSFHRDADGRLMSAHTAAVELLNVLRPTVAVARYIVFGALAMYTFPAGYERIAQASPAELAHFIDEVRRFYPFAPMAAARVRETFQWRGAVFPRHRRVLLDLYATNHDPRIWGDPDVFRPERFGQGAPRAYGLIPQGPGDFANNHRCPGEAITLALTGVALRFLASGITFHVPPQDLEVPLRRMPTGPASGFVIEGGQRAVQAAPPRVA